MILDVRVQYQLTLSAAELRVLSRALRCRLDSEAMRVEALALQEKLMLDRAVQLRGVVQEAEKAEQHIEAKGT